MKNLRFPATLFIATIPAMPYLVTGFLILAGVIFWGAGLSLLVTPWRYRRFALIFSPVAGLSLQSLVVWLGAYADLKGTDSYARMAWLLPAILLVAGCWRIKSGGARFKLAGFSAVFALMAMQLVLMVLPFLLSGLELTTVTIGSLDAADYGAGARVLQEFAHSDRSGFLGLKEVVSVGAVDNFYDFWLRTNHFTPSALIAFNGSVLGLKPYQLTGLATIVFFVATLPMVFWLARAGLRYRPGPSLAITAIYAFNPINWYAVYNVAPAQILAANAIALLTWCGVALWREGADWKRGWRWAAVLAVAFGLILGSYNFIVIVCLVPAVAYAGGLALWQKRWSQLGRWLVLIAVPLALAGAIYTQRSLGVVERLLLFRSGFGWDIQMLTPEGWLGLVDGVWLTAYPAGWRLIVAIAAAGLILIPLINAARQRQQVVFLAACLTLPILIGYGILQLRHVLYNTTASYEAYKLFAVFYPGMLAAFCFWIARWLPSRGALRFIGVVGVGVVFSLNLLGEWRVFRRLISPVSVVSKNLLALGTIETMPSVASVNMRLPDGWTRLWASAMILKTPHYFDIHSYEGRNLTTLYGEWDLVGDFFGFDLPAAADSLHPAPGYKLLRRASPCFLEADFGGGWAEKLRDDPHPSTRTRWVADGSGLLRLNNPQPEPLVIALRAELRSLHERDCEILVGGKTCARLTLNGEPQLWEQEHVILPPGETLVEFRTTTPADLVGGRLKNNVTIAVDGLDIRVLGRASGVTAPQ